jgi:flagellar hook-length control protein FliK
MIRLPAPFLAAQSRKNTAATTKASSRDVARAGRQRRADEASAVERTPADPAIGRTAAASVAPAAGGTVPVDPRNASQAAARRLEPRIQVVDLRKKPAAADAPGTGRSLPKAQTEKTDGPLSAVKPFVERLAAVETSGKAVPPARGTPLERLRQMTGADLVRTAGLVVRDGGGEIRLTLKPESLGSVRIRLSLEDGKVEGRIVVDTPEARQAFEAGLESLTRALQADGFRTGSLQVSVSGGNASDSRQAAGLLGDTIAAARLRASDAALQAAVPAAGWTGGGDGLVNVFA